MEKFHPETYRWVDNSYVEPEGGVMQWPCCGFLAEDAPGCQERAAAATAPCCPPGSHPYLDYSSYTPSGAEITLADGTELYATGAPSANAVLVIPDVFGWHGGRTRALADVFAKHGHYAVVPKLLVPALNGGTHGALRDHL